MSSSIETNNKTNNILILGKDFTQRLNNAKIYAEKLYSINFTIMGQTVIYLLMVQKFINLNQKIVATPLCPRNFSKDYSVDNMKKTGLNRYVYAVDDILNIHKYLI